MPMSTVRLLTYTLDRRTNASRHRSVSCRACGGPTDDFSAEAEDGDEDRRTVESCGKREGCSSWEERGRFA